MIVSGRPRLDGLTMNKLVDRRGLRYVPTNRKVENNIHIKIDAPTAMRADNGVNTVSRSARKNSPIRSYKIKQIPSPC